MATKSKTNESASANELEMRMLMLGAAVAHLPRAAAIVADAWVEIEKLRADNARLRSKDTRRKS